MSAWESTRTPSLRKSASCSIIALRNNSESPILGSSATVHSPSVDWSLLKEPHGGRLRQRPLPFTHSRGHYQWKIGSHEAIADNGVAARFVLGEQRLSVEGLDLPNTKVVLKKNGEEIASATGAAVLGDPARAVAWLANKLAEHHQS